MRGRSRCCRRPMRVTTATARAASASTRSTAPPEIADRDGHEEKAPVERRRPAHRRDAEILSRLRRLHRGPDRRRLAAWVKANEELTFEAARPDHRDRGRIRLRQVHLRQGADGARDGDRRHHPLRGRRDRRHLRHQRGTGADRLVQMVFQNPNDTLNPSQTVGSQIARVIASSAWRPSGRRPGRGCYELLDLVKLPRDFAEAHAAPALGRPEAAHRHRAGLRRRPQGSWWRTNPSPRSTSRCRPP
jgi:hypothetical protein